MIDVMGIKFDDSKKVYNFYVEDDSILVGDKVIVETDKGLQIAKVVTDRKSKPKKDLKSLKQIIRIANEKDLDKQIKNKEDALKAMSKADSLAKRLKLKMNFIDANYTFDKGQLMISYLAESRIDFRELARELGAMFKTRIELRQIGVRDKAREVGGVGQCGRGLCCATFLTDMESVSISMAKNQDMSLNPNKINGQCGRLLCCLKYENDQYSECRKCLPKVGTVINNSKVKGKVVNLDIVKMEYTVLTEDNEKVVLKGSCNRNDTKKLQK